MRLPRPPPPGLSSPIVAASFLADLGNSRVPVDRDEPGPSARAQPPLGEPAGGERGGHHGETRPQDGRVLRALVREHLGGLDGETKAPRELSCR